MKYLIFFLSFNAYGAELLTWTAPTHRMDGSLLLSSEIAGYKVFCYQGNTLVLEQSVSNVTAVTIDLPSGDSGCRMVTIDTDGRYSDRSNRVSVTVTIPPPKPPVLQ